MFDRFAIVLGHYKFYMDYHGGQGSWMYQRMCKIESYFTPGFNSLNLDHPENWLAKEVYGNLVTKHAEEHGKQMHALYSRAGEVSEDV